MTTTAPVHILLVDDDLRNLVVLDSILEPLGEHLVRATSGEEALRHVLATDFAAILMDVRMPTMSGFETAKLIRSRSQSKTTPIIFLTASEGRDVDSEEAYALGAVDFLTKPLVPAALKAKVSVFVELFRKSEQLKVAERERVEAQFRGKEELWQTTLSSIGDAVIATDTERRVTFLNGEAERLTGWTALEAIGRDVDEVFPIVNEETRTPVQCPVRKVLETGHVVGLANHTILLGRGGNDWPIDDSAAPIRDAAGIMYGVVLVFRDISDKKRDEAALKQREARYRAVIETAIDCIVGMDHEGLITEFNPAAEQMFGYRREEVLGQEMGVLIVPPEHREGHRAGLARYLVTGEAPVLGRRLELPALRKGGERILCELSITRNPGDPPSFTGFLRDITERKRSEEELRRSEERYRTLFGSMTEGFCIVQMLYDDAGHPSDYRFLEVNPTFEAHTGLKGAVGRTIREMVPDHDAHWFEIYGRVAETGEPARFVNEAKAMGRWFDVHAYQIGGPQSRRVAILFNDITSRRRAEEQILASEERLRTVTQAARVGLVIVGEDRRYRFANRAYGEMLGLPAENIVGLRVEDVLAPVYEEQIRPRLDLAFKGERVTYELRVPPTGASRSPRFSTVSYEPQRDATGVHQVVVVLVDVTERREAEAAVRESEERFRQLAETIPNLAWMARPDGHLFWYNRRWYEYTGTTAEEMEGWGWQKVHHPEELPKVMERWAASITTGEPFNMVFPLKGVDNTFRPFLTLINPLRNATGEILFWFGTNTDISEQKRIEEELARTAAAENRRAALLTEVAESSRGLNAVLSVESITPLLAAEARRIIGAHVAVASLTKRHDLNQDVRAVSLSEKYADFRGKDLKPDGLSAHVAETNHPLRLSEAEVKAHPSWNGMHGGEAAPLPTRGWLGVPLIGHGGRSLGVVQLSDKENGDFTAEDEAVLVQLAAIASVGIENASLYDSLREQDRRKDEFLATLAHELRNPLAPVRTGLHVLRSIGTLDGPALRTRDMMERQVTHMVRLIDDLLDVSRVSRGKVDLKKERVDLRAVIESALETSRPLIEAAGHELALRLPAGPLPLEADPTRLAQVVSNLLNNAAKYTPDHGHIRLSAERIGAEIIIRVEDTGIGIPHEMLPKVFDLFTQVGRSIDRAQGGLGIGLSLVKKLVEMHGGSVVAESPGSGKGTTFTIWLPVAPESGHDDQRGTDGPRTLRRSVRHRILIVDDNEDGAESLAMLLQIAGHETRTAHSGPAALPAARDFRPDVVFLDIGLPGMNGYDVARALRGDPALPPMALVALTGWGSDEDRKRSREAGFDFHLTKPVDTEALDRVLTEVTTGQKK